MEVRSVFVIHTPNFADCDAPSLLLGTFTAPQRQRSSSSVLCISYYMIHLSHYQSILHLPWESSSLAQLSIDSSVILPLPYPCFDFSSQDRARPHYFYIVQPNDLFKQVERYVECHPAQDPQNARKSAFQCQRPNRRLESKRSLPPNPMPLSPEIRRSPSLRSQANLTAKF